MKKQVAILVGIILIALALSGVLLYTLTNPAPPQAQAGQEPTVSLASIPGEQPVDITVSHPEGAYTLSRAADGTLTMEELDDLPIEQGRVEELAQSVSNLSATQALPQTDDFAQYGLDAPAVAIQVKHADQTASFSIGDAAPSGMGYYLLLDEQVYLVDEATAAPFLRRLDAYISLTVADPLAEEETLEKVSLTPQDGQELAFIRQIATDTSLDTQTSTSEAQDTPLETTPAFYQMTAPFKADLTESQILGWAGAPFGMIAQEVAVIRPNAEQRAALGLDAPAARLTLETSAGRSITLLLSEADAAGTRKLLRTDLPIVYTVQAASASWATITLETLLGSVLPQVRPEQVSSFTITGADASYNFARTADQASCNGQSVTVQAFEELAEALLGMTPSPVAAPEVYPFEPVLTLRLTYADVRADDLLELLPTGDGGLFLRLNGTCAYATSEQYASTLLAQTRQALSPS